MVLGGLWLKRCNILATKQYPFHLSSVALFRVTHYESITSKPTTLGLEHRRFDPDSVLFPAQIPPKLGGGVCVRSLLASCTYDERLNLWPGSRQATCGCPVRADS